MASYGEREGKSDADLARSIAAVVQAYETPQHYYEGPAGANIGERLLSLQREGLSMEMPTFLGQNVSGQWGQYIPDEEYRVVTGNDGGAGFEVHRGGAAIPNIDTLNRRLLRQEGNYRRNMTPEQLAELDEFQEGQENEYGTRAWLERRYRNAPENWQPPMEAPLAVLLSTQTRPDEVYEGLTPEQNVKIQRTRNLDLQNVARHEAGHHGLALSGVRGEEFNRAMDYITTRAPTHDDPRLDYRAKALKNLGISEPEMIRKFESETDFRKYLDNLLDESNARLIAQGRPPIDNTAIIEEALAERRQALSRAVYPPSEKVEKNLQDLRAQKMTGAGMDMPYALPMQNYTQDFIGYSNGGPVMPGLGFRPLGYQSGGILDQSDLGAVSTGDLGAISTGDLGAISTAPVSQNAPDTLEYQFLRAVEEGPDFALAFARTYKDELLSMVQNNAFDRAASAQIFMQMLGSGALEGGPIGAGMDMPYPTPTSPGFEESLIEEGAFMSPEAGRLALRDVGDSRYSDQDLQGALSSVPGFVGEQPGNLGRMLGRMGVPPLDGSVVPADMETIRGFPLPIPQPENPIDIGGAVLEKFGKGRGMGFEHFPPESFGGEVYRSPNLPAPTSYAYGGQVPRGTVAGELGRREEREPGRRGDMSVREEEETRAELSKRHKEQDWYNRMMQSPTLGKVRIA